VIVLIAALISHFLGPQYLLRRAVFLYLLEASESLARNRKASDFCSRRL